MQIISKRRQKYCPPVTYFYGLFFSTMTLGKGRKEEELANFNVLYFMLSMCVKYYYSNFKSISNISDLGDNFVTFFSLKCFKVTLKFFW